MIGFVCRVYVPFPLTMCHAPRQGMKHEGQARLETSLHDPSQRPLYTSFDSPWHERHDRHDKVWSAGGATQSDPGHAQHSDREPSHRHLTPHRGPPVHRRRGDGTDPLGHLVGGSQKGRREQEAHIVRDTQLSE